MTRKRRIVPALLGGAYGPPVSVVIQPDGTAGLDCAIDSSNPNTNAGTADFMGIGERLGSTRTQRGLAKFDLSSIPAMSKIVSATLSLYATNDIADTASALAVYRMKRAWVEGEATWNVYSTGNNWQTAGGFGANDCEQTAIGSRPTTGSETLNEFKDIPLNAEYIEDLDLGNGWMIKTTNEANDAYSYSSSEHATAENRPKLSITYQAPL